MSKIINFEDFKNKICQRWKAESMFSSHQPCSVSIPPMNSIVKYFLKVNYVWI
mgnify:CR=1 FL=1